MIPGTLPILANICTERAPAEDEQTVTKLRTFFTFEQKYTSRNIQARQKWSIKLQRGHDSNLNDIVESEPDVAEAFGVTADLKIKICGNLGHVIIFSYSCQGHRRTRWQIKEDWLRHVILSSVPRSIQY
jgi:hypothetical protein